MPRRLLLIDDDESTRITLAALLEDEGFVVDEASDAEQVAPLLEQHQYSAVLLDWHLGAGSGAAVLPAINRIQPDARTVVITGERRDAEGAQSVFGVYQKTDEFDDLLQLLR